MDSKQISYIIALLFAVAILVILIVILAKYKGGPPDEVDAHNVNVKVNWLYWINIVEVGLIVIFGVLALLAYRNWCIAGACMKA
jgi:hypothetical protein